MSRRVEIEGGPRLPGRRTSVSKRPVWDEAISDVFDNSTFEAKTKASAFRDQ